MKRVVLVNGVPASGKSTVSQLLTDHLWAQDVAAVPMSLDTVKEALYVHLGIGDREHNRKLGRASYLSIFSSIATFPDTIVPVIDAWHGFQPVSVLREHLALAEVEHVVEVWCQVSPATAAARYRNRKRHPGHLPASYAGELFELAGRAQPIAIGPVITIDTEAAISQSEFGAVTELLKMGNV